MTCHTRNPVTTVASTAVKVRQRCGITACMRWPSSRSRRHSAVSATAVAAIASSIAASLSAVGLLENRVSMVAEKFRPAGAGPVRSVNTPTIAGRRFGSGNPLRISLPVVGSVNPTNVANVPDSSEVISIREHPPIFERGTLAITTLRSVMSTRCVLTLTNSEFSAACLPFCGARPNTSPPWAGIVAIRSHGMVADSDTGACEISGAVTLLSWPPVPDVAAPCGQFSVAVVCTTGSRGVSTDRTKPISPAIVATHRVTFTSWAASRALAASVCVMGVP